MRRQKWTFIEDTVLIDLVNKEKGLVHWELIAHKMNQAGYNKTYKQVKRRWYQYLSPDLNNDEWREDSTVKLFNLYNTHRNQWKKIAVEFKGRTDNYIKNKFFSKIRKIIRLMIKYSQFQLTKTSTKEVNRLKSIVLAEFLDSCFELPEDKRGDLGKVYVFEMINEISFMKPVINAVEFIARNEKATTYLLHFLISFNNLYITNKQEMKNIIRSRKKKGLLNLIQHHSIHMDESYNLSIQRTTRIRSDSDSNELSYKAEEQKEQFSNERFAKDLTRVNSLVNQINEIKIPIEQSESIKAMGLLKELHLLSGRLRAEFPLITRQEESNSNQLPIINPDNCLQENKFLTKQIKEDERPTCELTNGLKISSFLNKEPPFTYNNNCMQEEKPFSFPTPLLARTVYISKPSFHKPYFQKAEKKGVDFRNGVLYIKKPSQLRLKKEFYKSED